MSQAMSQLGNKRQPTLTSRVALIVSIGIVSLIAGILGGMLSGRFMSPRNAQGTNQGNTNEMREIVVSNEGLVFKMEDGTPIAMLGTDNFGAYFRILSKLNRPVAELADSGGKGVITVGSSAGTSVYVIAHKDGGTITMIGRYGKQVVDLSSNTDGGGGVLTLSEGSKGNKAVEIGTESPRKKSSGIISIFNNIGIEWQAP
jgi:hypothetical protein